MDREQREDTRRGFRESATGALRSAADLARARTDLLLLEAAEARDTSRTLSRFAGVGLVAIAAGYTLLLAAGAHSAANHWFDGNFAIPAAIIAALHLFVGIVLLIAARARLRRARFFETTLDQFQRDRQWLNELQDDLKKSA